MLFGENGAGKSSFVDAVEAVITNGKVKHLSHNYSGHYQEKGLINTKRPHGTPTTVDIQFIDGTVSSVNWSQKAPIRTVDPNNSITKWDLQQTVLRQEELSDFIRSTKGDKYSTVLPLLGLGGLETLANNLHKLAKSIAEEGKLQTLRAKEGYAREARREVFGDITKEALSEKFLKLRRTYEPQDKDRTDQQAIESVLEVIDLKVESLGKTQQFAAAIADIANSKLMATIEASIPHQEKVASFAEDFLTERLKVLNAADDLSIALTDDTKTLACPACGRNIKVEEFNDHLSSEKKV